MKNNKNHNLIERSNYEKITHYSIRKVSFGAASVAIAVAFMFLGGRSVSAAETNNAPATNQSATANTKDEAANQVFDAPSNDANVTELNTKLQALPDKISNNTKINDMDQLGATTGVEAGKVKDITEFGGWTAIKDKDGQGHFIIARKSDKGVFPIETVNSVRQGDNKLVTWLNESTFDRKGQYMLFLGNVRTEINKDKPVTLLVHNTIVMKTTQISERVWLATMVSRRLLKLIHQKLDLKSILRLKLVLLEI